jgi:hypothetical protein
VGVRSATAPIATGSSVRRVARVNVADEDRNIAMKIVPFQKVMPGSLSGSGAPDSTGSRRVWKGIITDVHLYG